MAANDTGDDPLADGPFCLHNVTAESDHCFETEDEALNAVSEYITSGERWTITVTPARSGAEHRIHSGYGPA